MIVSGHSQSLRLGLQSFGYSDCIFANINFRDFLKFFVLLILAPSYSPQEGLSRSLVGIKIGELFPEIRRLYLICVGRNLQKIRNLES